MRRVAKYFAPRTAIFLIMTILILLFIGQIADIALMLFAAFVVACTMNPMVDKLASKGIPRVCAVSILLLLLLLLILGILIPLVAACAEQFLAVIKQVPRFIGVLESNRHLVILGIRLDDVIDPNTVKTYLTGLGGNILAQSINVTKILADSLTTILAVSIMVFYITTDSKMLRDGYIAVFPPKFKQKAGDILDIIQIKVGGFVWAQLIAMIFVGALTTIGLWLIGHNHAILLGFLTALFDIIPVIGPTIAVALGLYTSIKFGFWYVVLTFVIYMIAQWMQNQLLRPLVFGKLMDMHPLTIIFSLLVGAKFLGVWGVILAPAIASVLCVLFDELYIKTINSKDRNSNEPESDETVEES